MVTSVPDNMEGCFTEIKPVKYFRNGARNIKYQKYNEEYNGESWTYGYAVLRDVYKNSEKINGYILSIIYLAFLIFMAFIYAV